jgi:hypothetical protein
VLYAIAAVLDRQNEILEDVAAKIDGLEGTIMLRS